MLKGLYPAMTVAGVMLLSRGKKAYQCLGSELTKSIADAPSSKTIWLLAGGAVATLAGICGFLFGRHRD